jgi:BMFP domain-containing protein YqiC
LKELTYRTGETIFHNWKKVAEKFLLQEDPDTPLTMLGAKNTASKVNAALFAKRSGNIHNMSNNNIENKEAQIQANESKTNENDMNTIDLTSSEEIEKLEAILKKKKDRLTEITTKYQPVVKMITGIIKDQALDPQLLLHLVQTELDEKSD